MMTLGEMTFKSYVIFGSFLKIIKFDLQTQISILGAPFWHWLRLSMLVIKIFVAHYQQLS